ncbi:MAG: cytidine deaminase [Clostridiales bacterium]|nr:cytidine deaminase [Clostridiales bacterium]
MSKDLITEAQRARQRAYAPYSGITVGAALLAASGIVYQGANIENAAYAGICAERAAFVSALLAGEREFTAIAVSGGPAAAPATEYFYPCGVCRQWMAEFCAPDFLVIAAVSAEDFKEAALSKLLPLSFGPGHLKK